MKLILIILLMVSANASADVLPYKTKLLTLGTRYRALHTCNCLYVMNMKQDYCINYSKVDPPVFTVLIDAANKSVSSGVSGVDFKPITAKFMNSRTGCHIINDKG